MRERGLEHEYFSRLDPSLHATLREVESGQWLDIAVALSHYETMDALFPSEHEQIEIGRELSMKRRNSYLLSAVTTAIRTSRISPLTILRRSPSIWSRLLDGGGPRVTHTAPKSARITLYAEPLGRIGYFRTALRGVLESGVAIVVDAPKVRAERALHHGPGEFDLVVSWGPPATS
jgi:hypothetical protein